MKNFFYITFVAALAFVGCKSNESVNAGKASIETRQDSISYAIGLSIGSNLQDQGLKDLNNAAFLKGLMEHGDTAKRLMDPQSADMLVREEMQRIRDIEIEKAKSEGTAFLEENRSKEGVIETESGLQYKVLEAGTGASPAATDEVTVHYEGTLIDGTVFDSSYERGEPATFRLNQVIKGWTEGVQLMKEGATYEFYIPQDLAYGQRGSGNKIKPYSTLIFKVELIEVGGAAQK